MYVTYAQAADLLGVAVSTVTNLVARGELSSRGPHGPGVGGLDRAQVEALVVQREHRRQLEEEQRQARLDAPRGPRPPDEVHEWLTVTQAADVVGLTRNAIKQQCIRERLPYVWHEDRRWIRRDLLELRQRARQAQVSRCP